MFGYNKLAYSLYLIHLFSINPLSRECAVNSILNWGGFRHFTKREIGLENKRAAIQKAES